MPRKDSNGTIHIVKSSSKELNNSFYSQQAIGESGVYRVHHDQHGLPSEVTLRAGQTFPACSKCSEPVRFELVRQLIGEDTGFFVNLYSLPATDAPATHSDAHIHEVPNPQQQREHDAAEAFVHGQRNGSEDNEVSDDDNEAA